MKFYDIYQTVLMSVSLYALIVIGLGYLFVFASRVMLPIVRWIKAHKVDALLVAPFVLCMVWTGSTKSGIGRVTYPFTDVEMRYLYDAGSYVTNDYVHVEFTKSAVVPDSADFLGYFRPIGSTNDAEWVCFLDTTFAQFHSPSNVPFAGAITNDFQFFTTYTPGPVVHTNGVAVVNWQRNFEQDGRYLATVRTGVYTNGFRIAPNPGITNGPPAVLIMSPLTGSNQDE